MRLWVRRQVKLLKTVLSLLQIFMGRFLCIQPPSSKAALVALDPPLSVKEFRGANPNTLFEFRAGYDRSRLKRKENSSEDRTRRLWMPLRYRVAMRQVTPPHRSLPCRSGMLTAFPFSICTELLATLHGEDSPRFCACSGFPSLDDRLGPTHSWPTTVPKKPFSTSVFKFLT